LAIALKADYLEPLPPPFRARAFFIKAVNFKRDADHTFGTHRSRSIAPRSLISHCNCEMAASAKMKQRNL
jgi:hypothetical protein